MTGCRPRFDGHLQPRLPAWGTYDDRDPAEVGRRVALGRAHGIDAFVHGVFWCRGKRVFEDALEQGFLGSPEGSAAPFAVFWANRMPRRILPVRRADLPVIEGERRVPTDVEDFVELVRLVATQYFARANYMQVEGRPYFAIYDSTFFLRELGEEGVAEAIRAARGWLAANGFGDMFLAAIEPAPEALGRVAALGFDAVTHYVFLPEWKGPRLQDYAQLAARREAEWAGFGAGAGLPYLPAVATGWDASPRALDFGAERPGKYPWSPVVVGEHPQHFGAHLAAALRFARATRPHDPLVFVASWNEWSEGHHLEPDTRFGTGWLEALQAAREHG